MILVTSDFIAQRKKKIFRMINIFKLNFCVLLLLHTTLTIDLIIHLNLSVIVCLVIVEEGTEALEPYIVSSLTEHVQHLILIGKYVLSFIDK